MIKYSRKMNFFCLLQLRQQPLRVRLARREIFRIVAVGGGEQTFAADIFGALGCKVALIAVFLHHRYALRVQAVNAVQVRHQLFQLAPRRLAPAERQVQDAPDERQEQNGYDPRDLVFRVDVRIDDIQHEYEIDRGEQCGENGREVEQV